MRVFSISTAVAIGLGLLPLTIPTAKADYPDAWRYVQRCDRDGDYCATFRCDADGDDCVRVSSWSYNYNRSYRYPSYYRNGWSYPGYYGTRYYTTRRQCDADGDDCVTLRCDADGDNCRVMWR